MSATWPVVSVEQMRALEAAAFSAGTSEDELQANAAAQLARVAQSDVPAEAPIIVLVGPGNNGRDAFLAGRMLAQRGRTVTYVLTPRHAIQETELEVALPPTERVLLYSGPGDVARLEAALVGARLAIDGLLGIGVRGPLREPLGSIVALLNKASAQSNPRVLSVDIPSGIDADSGEVPSSAVRADLTVALGAVKSGCLRFPAASYTGVLVPRPIGLPAAMLDTCTVRLLTADQVAGLVPTRPRDAHKGTLGWVAIVGGSRDYVGAPILSASAAARSGCGLVALSVPSNVQVAAAVALPEATYVLRDESSEPSGQAASLIERLADYEAAVIGPGLSASNEAALLVKTLLSGLSKTEHRPAIVLDADALNILAQWDRWWDLIPAGCVLTPHYGEMARLTGLTTQEIAQHAWEIAAESASRWTQVVVLKGPHTVLAQPDAPAWVHGTANPALATAGTGDVLAGLIGGLAAQGLGVSDAARLAVVAHSLAATRVLADRKWRSLLASDLLPVLPRVLRELAG